MEAVEVFMNYNQKKGQLMEQMLQAVILSKKEGFSMKKLIPKGISVLLAVVVNVGLSFAAETAPTQYAEADSIRYAYRELNPTTEVPLVLIHRFRGTMNDWDPAFVNALAKERRVILLDNAGVGSSSGMVATSIREMGDHVARFAQAKGLQQIDILGWSMGGLIAQSFLVEHPDLVRRAVLVGAAPGGSTETIPPQPQFSQLAGKLSYTEDDQLFLFFGLTPQGREAGRASLERIAARRDPSEPAVTSEGMQVQRQALVDWFQGAGNYFSRLKEIKQPVLVINGDKDQAFPVFDSVLLFREIPNAQLAIYPGAGHAPHHQYPDEVARTVLTFLR